MKKILTIILLLIISQLRAYDFKVVSEKVLENGCKSYHIQEQSVPWDIYTIEIDLTNKRNRIKFGLANDRVSWIDNDGNYRVSKETVGKMIKRKTDKGASIVAGVNADFFNMQTGMQFVESVWNGNFTSSGISMKPHCGMYIDQNNVPYIGMINCKSALVVAGRGSYVISGYNSSRGANRLVVYNKLIDNGNISFAPKTGTEILIESLDMQTFVNGVRNYKVIEKSTNVTIKKDNQIIVSGDGLAKDFVDKTEVGQIVQIETNYIGLENVKIKQVIGSWGYVVKNGIDNSVEAIALEGTMEHELARHPRTCAGFNKEKTKLYLTVIDGRSSYSKGMNLSEVANFMIDKFNIWQGLAFDGGGSSVIMHGNTTLNRPSGITQRAITNALLIYNEEPTQTSISYNFTTSATVNLNFSSNLYLEVDKKNKQSVWVTEIDIKTSNNFAVPVSPKNKISWKTASGVVTKSKSTLTKLTQQINSESDETSVIAAVEGSPFSAGDALMNKPFVINGKIACSYDGIASSPAIYFDTNNVPFIDTVSIRTIVKAVNGNEYTVSSFNSPRYLDYMVVYNQFSGSYGHANIYGVEVVVEPQKEGFVNAEVDCLVKRIINGNGKRIYKKNQFLLSANGKANDFVNNNISVGDKIKFKTIVECARDIKIKNIVSGTVQLIKAGKNYLPNAPKNVEVKLGNSARTAIGYNENKSKMYLFSTDAYSENTRGISYEALVDVMKKYKIYDALCLKGGESTTLLINDAIKNSIPQEDLIANALVFLNKPKVVETAIEDTKNWDLEKNIGVKVYPNPFVNKLGFEFNNKIHKTLTISLYNIMGQKVKVLCKNRYLSAGVHQLYFDISNLNIGVYVYKAQLGATNIFGKIVKN